MSRVMIVAGGAWQCPIVRTAKAMGHEVLCTNLYADSPAFEFADACEVADVLDRDRNLQIAKSWKPDAVLTDQSDIAVPTVAYVSEQLGLRGIGTKMAQLYTNKHKMMDYCAEHGFPHPTSFLCHSLDEARSALRGLDLAIIKPLDSQSSRGVHIISSPEQLEANYDDCVSYSNSEHAILLEEYIQGVEFTVDGLKTEQGYWPLAISRKKHFDYNENVASELLFSHYDAEFDYDALRALNTAMVQESGLPFGLTHTEYKYRDGNYYLIEMAARGGGTRISSDLVPIMSGVNSNEVLIDALLGRSRTVEPSLSRDKWAILGFFDFVPGKVRSIEGLDEARSVEGVRALGLDVAPGDTIEQASDDRARCGYYIIEATSKDELRHRERLTKEMVRVVYER